MTPTDTRERATREAQIWSDGMTGVPGEFYRQGFEAGFRVGYAAAEDDQSQPTHEAKDTARRGRWTGDLRRTF